SLIRDRVPPTLAEGQPEAALGVKGAQPPAASFPHFLSVQEMGPPAGAGPGKLRRFMSGKSVGHRQAPPLPERHI
uniref:hypothetical protein n=1 Tax=Anaerotruncus massiliensis (ex Liu et al. 2021) TaxID=2321404 RepID=UPI003AB3D31C